MNSAEKRFLYNVTSLSTLVIPKLHRVVCGLIVFMVLAAGLILYFTPWIQTAYGTGAVDSLDPNVACTRRHASESWRSHCYAY